MSDKVINNRLNPIITHYMAKNCNNLVPCKHFSQEAPYVILHLLHIIDP